MAGLSGGLLGQRLQTDGRRGARAGWSRARQWAPCQRPAVLRFLSARYSAGRALSTFCLAGSHTHWLTEPSPALRASGPTAHGLHQEWNHRVARLARRPLGPGEPNPWSLLPLHLPLPGQPSPLVLPRPRDQGLHGGSRLAKLGNDGSITGSVGAFLPQPPERRLTVNRPFCELCTLAQPQECIPRSGKVGPGGARWACTLHSHTTHTHTLTHIHTHSPLLSPTVTHTPPPSTPWGRWHTGPFPEHARCPWRYEFSLMQFPSSEWRI